MPKFKKREQAKSNQAVTQPYVFIPNNARINEENISKSSPITEYERGRVSIGRNAYRQVTGR